jgi:DNA-binding PadR family transcriptional regulator
MNDLVLLAALLREAAYGYSLKKTAGLIFGTGAMHNNVIYPSLKKFTRNGWVEQASVPGDRGQQRKQYRITPAGRKTLIEQLGTFGDQEAGDEGAFLFRVALFDVLPKEKREAIVAARKSYLTTRAMELSELREATRPKSFGAVALDRVQTRVKDELRWIHQVENEFERGV